MVTTNATVPMATAAVPRRVVVVSKQPQMSGVLETVLDSGHYDVIFVESTERAYSHIKQLAPHLILVCLDIDDIEGFQLLSMLKLDGETRGIPVVTCTAGGNDDEEAVEETAEPSGGAYVDLPVLAMN